jgi:hypothetical protein
VAQERVNRISKQKKAYGFFNKLFQSHNGDSTDKGT